MVSSASMAKGESPRLGILAIIGPGLVADISVTEHHTVPEGTRLDLDPATRVVALDGERRLIRGDETWVDVRPGAHLLSVSRALAGHAHAYEKSFPPGAASPGQDA